MEGCWDSLIEIPDSPVLIPIPPLGGEQLVETEDNKVPDLEDGRNWVIAEDLAEG